MCLHVLAEHRRKECEHSERDIRQVAPLLGYSSGQRGLTVNQLAFAYGGSNPSPSTKFKSGILPGLNLVEERRPRTPKVNEVNGVRWSEDTRRSVLRACLSGRATEQSEGKAISLSRHHILWKKSLLIL